MSAPMEEEYGSQAEWALWFARWGIPVFPVKITKDDPKKPDKTNKKPFTKNGHIDATTAEAQIRTWWSRWPDAAIGGSLGAVGMFAVDVDVTDGATGPDTLADLEGEFGKLPETVRVLTPSGGEHIWLKGEGVRSRNGWRPDIDIKGEGGWVVLPGSVSPLGIYDFEISSELGEVEVAEAPAAWLEQMPGRASGSSTSSGSSASGASDDLDKLRDVDREAVEVLVALGGHHPYVTKNAKTEQYEGRLTRPGKRSGNGAGVGFLGPGIVKVFTPNWTVPESADTPAAGKKIPEGVYDLDQLVEFQNSGELFWFEKGSTDRRVDPTAGEVVGTVSDEVVPAGALMPPVAVDDAHMGEAFAARLRGEFLYVAGWRRWLRWDGRRWADDDTEAVFEVARQWVLDLGAHMLAAGASADDVKRVAGYRSRSRLDAVVTLARRLNGVAARAEEFDADLDLLNVQNGVVDLTTGDLRPHDPALRLRKLAHGDYDPEAVHEDINAVVGVVDDEVRPWVQRLIGYAATGHVTEDVVAVFDGRGANGKTTLLEGVAAALGDYAGPAPAKLIMKSNNDEHPTLKADLFGQRLVWISETEEGGSLRMEQLKALTGGDRIKARFMRADYFSFEPTHTLVVATNHRPYVNSTEHAAWRRLRLVPFPFTYKSADEAEPDDRIKDVRLRTRLRTGNPQRTAMLAWIIAGAVQWHLDGLGESDTVMAATADWRRAEDVMARFIEDCLDLGVDARTRGSDLYRTYKDWCDAEGRPYRSNKNFAELFMSHDDVVSAGVEVIRPQNKTHYVGVQIRSTAGF